MLRLFRHHILNYLIVFTVFLGICGEFLHKHLEENPIEILQDESEDNQKKETELKEEFYKHKLHFITFTPSYFYYRFNRLLFLSSDYNFCKTEVLSNASGKLYLLYRSLVI